MLFRSKARESQNHTADFSPSRRLPVLVLIISVHHERENNGRISKKKFFTHSAPKIFDSFNWNSSYLLSQQRKMPIVHFRITSIIRIDVGVASFMMQLRGYWFS